MVKRMMTGTEFDIEKFDGMNDFGLWQLVGGLAAIDNVISDKDQALLLLTSLPSYYNNFMETLLYSRDTIKLEDVVATLNSRELQKMTEAKGDGGEGLYVRRRFGQRDMEQGTYSAWSKSLERSSRLRCYICRSEEHLKRDCPRYNHKKSQGCVRIEDHVSGYRGDGYDTVDLMMAMSGMSCMRDRYVMELRRNLISLGTLAKEGFTVKMQSGKIKVIMGSLVVLSGTRRANCIYTLDGQAVTRKTLKGRKQLGEYRTGWKIKTEIQQQNGLVEETNVTLLAKVRCFLFLYVRVFGWLASIKQGMLEPVKVKCIFLGYRKGIVGNKLWRSDDVTSKVVLYRNMGFNESGEYKKTFIGSGVGTSSVQVLQGVEFEVEPQEDHTFEVEPHGNVDHVVEDSNEAVFAVAAVGKIYAHESLTFNNTVACEVISKWKARLKDDMDARSDVYVLSNGCKKCSDDIDGYYWEYTPGDCDVEKNGKWSCIYAVGSQEYQMVCTRLDIASADVGRVKANLQHMEALSTTEAGYMTFTEAWKKEIWLKGLLT
ncbi:zinc finger, CCHC-type containing protein [Tanacetum coccineum]